MWSEGRASTASDDGLGGDLQPAWNHWHVEPPLPVPLGTLAFIYALPANALLQAPVRMTYRWRVVGFGGGRLAVVLLTLSTSMPSSSDLGFLLHKHPGRAQSFEVATGTVHVVWPEVTDERSTIAMLLEVDPVALVRGKGGRGDTGFSLSQYVNDRPYAASSMLSVALGRVFRTAMTGRCDARPELPAA